MIEISILVAFTVMFLHVTTWKEEIFGFVSQRTKHWPEKLRKPLFACPICMCPWWGALIIAGGNWFEIWQVRAPAAIIIMLSAGGINTVSLYLIKYCKAGFKFLKKQNDAT